MNKLTIINTAIGSFQIFNGLSGLLGGFGLINDPTGNNLQMKTEWLQKTPFQDFLIPGIVLFLLVGLANVIGAWITFSKKNKRGLIGLTLGIILMGWIVSQVAWIGYKSFLQALYFTTGFVQAILGFYLMRIIQKTQ
jgi:hypothetical protein